MVLFLYVVGFYGVWQLQLPWLVTVCATESISGGFPVRVVRFLAICPRLALENCRGLRMTRFASHRVMESATVAASEPRMARTAGNRFAATQATAVFSVRRIHRPASRPACSARDSSVVARPEEGNCWLVDTARRIVDTAADTSVVHSAWARNRCEPAGCRVSGFVVNQLDPTIAGKIAC